MSLKSMIICLSDYWHQRIYWQLTLPANDNIAKNKYYCAIEKISKLPNNSRKNRNNADVALKQRSSFKRLYISIDGICAYYILREIQQSAAFRIRLLQQPAFQKLELLWLQIVPPQHEIIDFKWNSMVTHSLWEHIEMEYLMSWLSTLGGGFSALGEQFSQCAQTAGKISMKQLEIGLRIGDPFLQARCKLYYSLSLIQTGRLRSAKYLVRQQYRFARRHREQDSRLVKMCHGIWLRIQYEYRLRFERKLASGDNARNLYLNNNNNTL